MFKKLARAAAALILASISLAIAAPIAAAADYVACYTDASGQANGKYYEHREYDHTTGVLGQTTIRSVHSCGANGSSLVPVVNLQGSGYQVQLGYGTIGSGPNDYVVTIADNSNPRGSMAYVHDLNGSNPVAFTPGHFTLFQIDFEYNCVVCVGTWHFTITDRISGASGSFTQTAHIIDVDDSGATTWWSPGEVWNLASQMGGSDSTNISAITQMKWRYSYGGSWVTATGSATASMCQYGSGPTDCFGGLPSYYVKGHNTDGDGNERITVYTTDVPLLH